MQARLGGPGAGLQALHGCRTSLLQGILEHKYPAHHSAACQQVPPPTWVGKSVTLPTGQQLERGPCIQAALAIRGI